MPVPVTWSVQAWYVMSIISYPLYLLVLISLLRLRSYSKIYNSTFYTLLVQHSIADLIAMPIFIVSTNWYRSIPFLRSFAWEYQEYYVAAASYNNTYYFLYIRCCGIALLSFQRFINITLPMATLTLTIKNAATWQVALIYWSIPTLLSIVVLKDTDFKYDGFDTMFLIAPREIIMRNTLMALIVVSVTCVLCSFFYTALGIFIRLKTANLSRNVRREIHLAGQVFVLLLAFFVMLVFYSFQNYFSQTENTGSIFFMRSLYPIANGLLSYINPYCILCLNREIAEHAYQTVRCKKLKGNKILQISSTNQSQITKNVAISAL